MNLGLLFHVVIFQLLILRTLNGEHTSEELVNDNSEVDSDDSALNEGEYISNHSEAIQKVLRDFEKTLEENKRLLEDENLDNTTISDSNLSDNTTDLELQSRSTRNRLACNNTFPSDSDNTPMVHLLNGTSYHHALMSEFNSSVTNRSSDAICSLTLFFASWCDFSAAAAPSYNALARVFPQLSLYAVDSSLYHSLNTQHGVMAVPTLLVFHNSRPLYKYNYTEYNLASFTEFVSLLTGLEPANLTEIDPQDFLGPVPSVSVKGTNYFLLLAVVFSLLCAVVHFSKSPIALSLLDTLRNAWREAEIQHEHED